MLKYWVALKKLSEEFYEVFGKIWYICFILLVIICISGIIINKIEPDIFKNNRCVSTKGLELNQSLQNISILDATLSYGNAALSAIELAITLDTLPSENIFVRLLVILDDFIGLILFGIIVYVVTLVLGPTAKEYFEHKE